LPQVEYSGIEFGAAEQRLAQRWFTASPSFANPAVTFARVDGYLHRDSAR
jgi:hypothetical protein